MGKENKVKNELFKALSSAKVQDNSISYTRIDCVDVVFINNNEKVEPLEFSKPNVTEFDSMQELVRSVTDKIKQESKMKYKNTEDYYNEQSKDSKFAPSFDNLNASAKNYWYREFDDYAKANKAIELEDGAPYIFNYGKVEYLARYQSLFNYFWVGNHGITPQDCTNIVKLVPEVK